MRLMKILVIGIWKTDFLFKLLGQTCTYITWRVQFALLQVDKDRLSVRSKTAL